MSPPAHPRLFETPDLYPYAFEGDACVFVDMDRAAYARSIFLDRRIDPAGETPHPLALASLLPPATSPPIGWIFHVAHCGSTLLARALDRPKGSLVLREPLALRQLGAEAANGPASDWPSRFNLTMALLARRYDPDAVTIIKANVPVNFMLPSLAARDPDAPAIFLHFPLVPYLLAILRSPNHRNWVRFVTDELRPGIVALAGGLPEDDAGRAASLWLAQLRAFAAAMAVMPNSRSLDAEALFAAPGPVVAAAAALFGQAIDTRDIASITAGPLFATYSKNPAIAFDNDARAARERDLGDTLAPELSAARGWVRSRVSADPLPVRLPRPLCPDLPLRDLL